MLKLKTKEDLIKEGKPLIKYTKDGKTYTQLFLSEWSCETRTRELLNKGYKVERMQ